MNHTVDLTNKILIPVSILPVRRSANMLDCEMITQPMAYISELRSIVFLRPIASAVSPPTSVPTIQPIVIRLAV